MYRVVDVVAAMEEWFDPRAAEPWDAVGLVCGDPRNEVERVLLAVDATPATVAEAEDRAAGLLITHHPLLLTAVHGVAADQPKGALVHRMIRSGIAHFVAHSNAEIARPGVSDALAERLDVRDCDPLEPVPGPPLDKLVVFVPAAAAEGLIDALADAGAGRLGRYERAAWLGSGTGTFRPLDGSAPAIGTAGRVESVAEVRVEMVLPPKRRAEVIAALRRAHPYEEPAFDVFGSVALPADRGVGRIGRLAAPMPLTEFVHHVADRLPAVPAGLRWAGSVDRVVERVALCAGSGGSLIDAARARGADMLLTADLKHHYGVEAVLQRTGFEPAPMALVDASHWATEVPWLDTVAARLADRFGTTVNAVVSLLVTDPWTGSSRATGTAAPTSTAPS
ncbi:MAG: Nif3-like dinuclear metal center hexameric protein [bacterium]